MAAQTVACEVCGETAILHAVRYEYQRHSWPALPEEQYTLKATRYDIACPKCGQREQVEVADSD